MHSCLDDGHTLLGLESDNGSMTSRVATFNIWFFMVSSFFGVAVDLNTIVIEIG